MTPNTVYCGRLIESLMYDSVNQHIPFKGIYSRFRIEIKFGICHYFNPKAISVDYIYLIIGEKANPAKKICPY